jgi:hypothetical protein
MNQEEQKKFLDADTAFLAFQHRNPDFVFSEELAREMALTLQAEGLDPRNVHHLSAAWLKIRPTPAPQPAPVSEPVDPIEAEARRMIASGEDYKGFVCGPTIGRGNNTYGPPVLHTRTGGTHH